MGPLESLRIAAETAFLPFQACALQPGREPRKILIVGYAAIGDLLFFLPVAQELRKRYPAARVTWLANDYPTTRELIPAAGLADEIWLHDWEGEDASAGRRAINERIAAGGFDLAVLTPASPAHYFQRGLARIPARAGHLRRFERSPLAKRVKRMLVSGELARRALLNRVAWAELTPEHSLQRNLRLLTALGFPGPFDRRPAIPLPSAATARAEAALPSGPWIGVHVAAVRNQYGKIWPPERFARACRELAKTSKARFALFGASEADAKEAVAEARAGFSGFVDVSGRALIDTFALIARCALFLSCDTGLAKAAMALGVPTATIFGPIDPAEFGVVWDAEKHLEIRTGIACSPCARLGMAREDRLNYLTCGHRDCIGKLEVGFALAALRGKYGALLGA